MGIDGLIILDNTHRPIIQSGFRASPPAYPLLHIDAFTTALAKAPRAFDIDPVLYVATPETPSACCHIQRGDVRILCPISGDVDPLLAFAFLQTFIEILLEYFETLSAATLKDNFDIVYQLLEETLDSGGHPSTTSTNALRDIVLPPSLFSKLLANVATPGSLGVGGSGSGVGAGAGAGAFSSPIPWRKAGLKYNSNDIYFDVVETLRAVVGRNGTPLSAVVYGKIETNAKLSGTPDLTLTFSNPGVIADAAFHPCVRLQRWARDKSLSFVPPDGHFILSDYRYAPPSAVNANAVVPLPINVKAHIEVSEFGGTLDITLTPRTSGRPIEHLSVELYLGADGTGASCAASGGGAWAFDGQRKVLKWDVPSLAPGSAGNVSLRGTFASSAKIPRPARALRLRFEIHAHTFSGLKVEQLKVTGEAYKPYKGVRGRSLGDIEWRW
ncbi:clathrin adaptor mu subunit [Athelia psychrophila]|uniref:Clathrin adaptor mu subunit n=1 Tax=Athelia psychrophila TaxID=1759441 RepID=A0A166R5B4_9AGAM|nr:clathrin adaptor mu subunit [Fibularhizoctonia sp. CBS 109695]